jgi:hypothetical protein
MPDERTQVSARALGLGTLRPGGRHSATNNTSQRTRLPVATLARLSSAQRQAFVGQRVESDEFCKLVKQQYRLRNRHWIVSVDTNRRVPGLHTYLAALVRCATGLR